MEYNFLTIINLKLKNKNYLTYFVTKKSNQFVQVTQFFLIELNLK